jgi:phage host-nuclease inhibitor protein Gam
MNVLDLIHTAETNEAAPPLRVGMLPEHLADYQDEEMPEAAGHGFKIETTQGADWALYRVAMLKAELRDIEAQARAAKERIDKRAESLKSKVARGVCYFEFKLLEYAEMHKKALLGGGKKKSRSFVHGVIGWRSSQERLEVTDKDALAAWLETQPVERGLYRTKVEPEMAAIQALYQTTGEIPPGCDIKPETDMPYVKAEAPETALVKGE